MVLDLTFKIIRLVRRVIILTIRRAPRQGTVAFELSVLMDVISYGVVKSRLPTGGQEADLVSQHILTQWCRIIDLDQLPMR